MTSSRRVKTRAKASKRSYALPANIKLGPCVLRFDHPKVMGIINNTPDSFSGDGLGGDTESAIRRGKGMFEAGAAMVDVGGESTRPGSDPVPIETEMERTIPIIEALSASQPGRVSIDTMKPEVAQAALLAGATMVNDVNGLRAPRMIEVVAEHDAAVIIMHMLGKPKTMQVRPRYNDVVKEIIDFLEDRIDAAENAGISSSKIMIDPGIGFGKNLDHNLEIIARLSEFRSLGRPIVIGVSRKSFIGRITGSPPEERLEGSLAAAVLAVRGGASMIRVHDVPQTVRALAVADAIIQESGKRAVSQGI